MVIASKATIGRWQQMGRESAQSIEVNSHPAIDVYGMDDLMAGEPIPLTLSMIYERVALLASNPAKPMVQQKQESQAQQVAGLNQLFDMVLDANDYEVTIAQGFYDIQFWNTCCLRWVVDMFSPGVLAEPGKITLEKIDLCDLFFDPSCKKLHWDYTDYIIQRHHMQIGEIQRQYPLSAHLVNPGADELISDASVMSRNSEDYIMSPQPKLARGAAGRRQQITVLEAWIKDSRLKFEPMVPEGVKPDYKDRYKLDKNGHIMGEWVPRYPNGRMIVVTQTAVLKDLANPFPHGQFPFVFAQGMPARVPYAAGNAARIMVVTRKINNLVSLILRYYMSEIPRPMHSTPGAMMDTNMAQNVPNDPSYILELSSPNARLERPQAVDIPPSVYSFIQFLQSMLDLVSGSGGIMRGQLAEGDQLSAEAVGALQQFASSRLALEAKFFEMAVKQLGYQLSWWLRVIVDAPIKMTVTLPTGDSEQIDWTSDRRVFERGDPTEIQRLRAREDYLYGIRSGTGSPGAQSQRQANFADLYRTGAIDRKSYLDSIEFPGRDAVIARMRQQELEDLQAKSMGRAMGVSISDTLRKADTPMAGSKGKI